MQLTEVVRFIYEHAMEMIDWDMAMLRSMTKTELTTDGFRIVSSSNPEYWVGMKEKRGTIFVVVHEPYVNYQTMVSPHVQEKAKTIFDQMVEELWSV